MTMTISGDGTITGLVAGGLPDATVTQPDLAANVAGNGPAFSAYIAVSTSIPNNTITKCPFNTKEFDTNSNFDNVTNYRFTPTVSGYYQINVIGGITNSAGISVFQLYLYKNGSQIATADNRPASTAIVTNNINIIVFMNGSTDYLEVYGYETGASASWVGSTSGCRFSGALVRAA